MTATISGSRKCGCGKTISANALHCRVCAGIAPPRECSGVLEILNVQGGDVKISFDQQNVAETIRARRIVTDMLRRGYALVVEIERGGVKAYERIKGFDEARGEYIVADLDSEIAAATLNDVELKPPADVPLVAKTAGRCKCGKPLRHRGACKGIRNRLPMESTKATGIGRSAGG